VTTSTDEPAGGAAPADAPPADVPPGDGDLAATQPADTRPVSGAQPAPPTGVLRTLLRLPIPLYRSDLGWVFGHRFLMLVHRGRKTHRRRETVLEVMRYDADRQEAIVAAGWGRKTQWLYNVEAGMATEVVIGRDRYAPAYRILEPAEAYDVLKGYEDENRLITPVVRAVLSRLAGWTYDGSEAARRRMVEQLPLVAFRPGDPASGDPG
jgi:deazaflavin-dependent oxidoreductase (nitroreductase family)